MELLTNKFDQALLLNFNTKVIDIFGFRDEYTDPAAEHYTSFTKSYLG